MKKITLFIFFVSLLNFCESQTKFSIYSGMNITTESNPFLQTQTEPVLILQTSSSGLNFYLGINSEFIINPVLALELNLIYSQRKYSQNYSAFKTRELGSQVITEPDYDNIKDFKYHTLDFRPLFYYGLPLGTGKISLGLGPSLSYRLKGSIKQTTTSAQWGNRTTVDNMKGNQLSAGISGTLKFEFGMGMLIHSSYNYVFDVQPGSAVFVIEVGVGYTFHFKRGARKSKK